MTVSWFRCILNQPRSKQELSQGPFNAAQLRSQCPAGPQARRPVLSAMIAVGNPGRMERRRIPAGRRMAIVCQPWDAVAAQTSSSIVHIACQLAGRLARDWQVTIYGRRGPGLGHRATDDGPVEFRRFTVLQKPQSIIVALLSVVSSQTGKCIPYIFSYAYHLLYALRVALSVRRYDAVLVVNFLQFASLIRFFNRSATICLYMHCEWLTRYPGAAAARRLRRVDLVVGCSDYITEAIKARFPTIAARCHTLHNGVDTVRFCPSRKPPAQRERPQRLLFVGRLSPEKGVHVLIEALHMLAQSHPLLRLDLVGDPDVPPYIYLAPGHRDPAVAGLMRFYGNRAFDRVRRQLVLRGRAYLADLTAAAAGDARIVFHGQVAQTDTLDFYREATVFVFPSIWHEAFGMPIIEASACGLPVVATYSGGIPEIVEHRRTGILVECDHARDLARAIGEVLDNPALARALGEFGRRRAVEQFSWEAVSRRLADLIENTSAARLTARDTGGAPQSLCTLKNPANRLDGPRDGADPGSPSTARSA
jgi:glycosyltransferase involved in cell wall biosynthesis